MQKIPNTSENDPPVSDLFHKIVFLTVPTKKIGSFGKIEFLASFRQRYIFLLIYYPYNMIISDNAM
jgi:hypothetical protein